STVFKIRDNIKLLAYGSKIGIVEPLKKLAQGGDAFGDTEDAYKDNALNEENEAKQKEKDAEYIENFKSLIRLYGFDKSKTAILLDSRTTSSRFLDFLGQEGIRYIDFAKRFKQSDQPTNLIYDHHWNSHGRELIAEEIAAYITEHKR
ncbi:MAG: hypothetical protein WBG48_09420, partial [Pricia sp.]